MGIVLNLAGSGDAGFAGGVPGPWGAWGVMLIFDTNRCCCGDAWLACGCRGCSAISGGADAHRVLRGTSLEWSEASTADVVLTGY